MRITHPNELFAHPVAIELKLRNGGGLHERSQVVEKIFSVDIGRDESFLAQPFGNLMSVALLGNSQDPAHGWGKTVRQTCH